MDIDRARLILGVNADTPLAEAMKRYLARAQMLHHDEATSESVRAEAEAMMKELDEAWRTVQGYSPGGTPPTSDLEQGGGGESSELSSEPAHKEADDIARAERVAESFNWLFLVGGLVLLPTIWFLLTLGVRWATGRPFPEESGGNWGIVETVNVAISAALTFAIYRRVRRAVVSVSANYDIDSKLSAVNKGLGAVGVCAIVYGFGVVTLGGDTEAENKAMFREVFGSEVASSRVFETINRHFVEVGHSGIFGGRDVGGELTPSGWVRVETERYSYAVPKNWSTKPDRDFDTYAEESDSGKNIFGIRGTEDGKSLGQMVKGARATLKKTEGVTDFTELSPFTVATTDDASRKVFPSVHALGGKSIQYFALIDIGKDEVLAFGITYTSTQDQDAMRKFSEQVMDTFVVKE